MAWMRPPRQSVQSKDRETERKAWKTVTNAKGDDAKEMSTTAERTAGEQEKESTTNTGQQGMEEGIKNRKQKVMRDAKRRDRGSHRQQMRLQADLAVT